MGWRDAPVVKDEAGFKSWYSFQAKKLGLDPNPDAPEHFYDYRAAYKAGAKPDKTGHWPSEFKLEGHPNLIIDGVDTRTGQPVRAKAAWESAPIVQDDAQDAPERTISGPPARQPGDMPYYNVPLPDPGVVAATAPIALAGAAVGPLAGLGVRGIAAAAARSPLVRAAAGYALGQGVVEPGLRAIGVPPIVADAVGEALGVGSALPEKVLAKGLRYALTGSAETIAKKAAPQAAKAAAAVATKAVDRGAMVAAQHAARVAFAKKVAAEVPRIKTGEKIWILLDEAGQPLKHLTPDQAGAATRAGKSVTWVKRLWD